MVPSATLVVRRPKEEVAMVARALVPLPRTRPYEKDDAPVPPVAYSERAGEEVRSN